jgi:hypothetical protein
VARCRRRRPVTTATVTRYHSDAGSTNISRSTPAGGSPVTTGRNSKGRQCYRHPEKRRLAGFRRSWKSNTVRICADLDPSSLRTPARPPVRMRGDSVTAHLKECSIPGVRGEFFLSLPDVHSEESAVTGLTRCQRVASRAPVVYHRTYAVPETMLRIRQYFFELAGCGRIMS